MYPHIKSLFHITLIRIKSLTKCVSHAILRVKSLKLYPSEYKKVFIASKNSENALLDSKNNNIIDINIENSHASFDVEAYWLKISLKVSFSPFLKVFSHVPPRHAETCSFVLCESKCADQLHSYKSADQLLCFR